MWTRKSKERQAREALLHAWSFMFADRKKKKRNFRRLWSVKINAAARMNGTTYSRLLGAMHKAGITLDRKALAEIALSLPADFAAVVRAAQA